MPRAARSPNRVTKPAYWDDAIRALAARDEVLARLIAAYPGLHLTSRGDPFTTLARAIVGQQISVKAAQTIWDRLLKACGGAADGALDPLRVQRRRISTLRACGLSERKAEYIRDLARHFASARLDPREWPTLSDEALIAALVDVKHGSGHVVLFGFRPQYRGQSVATYPLVWGALER